MRTAPRMRFLRVAMPEVSASSRVAVQGEIVMTGHYAGSLIPSKLIGMGRELDIAPLRSFVAVADCGGFQRAATSLHLSQGAVSQHVRRLESAVGHPLVERSGRGSRFTTAGEQLLHHARRVLAVHDEALHDVVGASRETLVVGSTEHAAAQVLPPF